MQSIITSYLIQNSECDLPYIGSLKIKKTGAKQDAATKQILPPSEEIIYSANSDSDIEKLVKYISNKKNIGITEAERSLNDFCKEWKVKIDSGEKFNLVTIGSVQKNSDGKIYLERENNYNFLQPIADEKINTREQQNNAEKENEIFEEKKLHDSELNGSRSYWGVFAITLAAIAFVIIFYHFYNERLSTSTIGDQRHFVIDSAAATYFIPGK